MLANANRDGTILTLNDVEFDVQMWSGGDWDHADTRFRVLKSRGLLELYADFWAGRPTPRRVVELGVWEGGSTVLWFEAFQPEKHVAIDVFDRADSPHFKSYIDERQLGDRLKTYWGVRQEDRDTIRSILDREFTEPIDVVIDDASPV